MAQTAIISTVITLANNILRNFVVEEGTGLYGLKEDIRWINDQMMFIEAYLHVAGERPNLGKKDKAMFKYVKNIAKDVLPILEKLDSWSWERKGILDWLKCAILSCCEWCTAREFVREIEKIRRRVENISIVRDRYGINDVGENVVGGNTGDPTQPMLHVPVPNFVDFQNKLEALKEKLIGPKLFDVVCIVGMAGVGKTTLASELYNSFTRAEFPRRARVALSQQLRIDEILEDIARQVDLPETMMRQNLKQNLHERLMREKFLVLIDNIWSTATWDGLKNGIPRTSEKGSRIIITSRDRGIGRHVYGEESLHVLLPLDFDNSWTLFSRMIMDGSQADFPSQLNGVGEIIVRRCGGLPKAISMVVGVLRRKERSEHTWKQVLKGIHKNVDYFKEIFSLSYNELPDDLKPFFLYFGLFPEGHVISAFQLINLWVAEGFIQASTEEEEEDEEEEDTFEYWACLHELVSRNLIEVLDKDFEGRIKSVRIHDLLHRLCSSFGKESNLFITRLDSASTSPSAKKARRVTTHHEGITAYVSRSQRKFCSSCICFCNDQTETNLSSFLCFDHEKDLGFEDLRNLLKVSLRFLQILVIEFGLYLSSEIPNEIGDLSFLSYLQLKGYVLDRNEWKSHGGAALPPSIIKLTKLLTLDVQECYNIKLPTCIWEMKQARNILLHRFAEFYDPSGLTSSVKSTEPQTSSTDLQTLEIVHSDHFNPHYLYRCRNLRRLGIYYPIDYTPRCREIINVLSANAVPTVLPNLERLEVRGVIINSLIPKMDLSRCGKLWDVIIDANIEKLPKLPSGLAKLTLSRAFLNEDPLETLGNLPCLRSLQLDDAYNTIISTSCAKSGSFPQLELLQIGYSKRLQKLLVEEDAMPKLKQFKVIKCELLKYIPDRLKKLMTVSN